MHRRKCLFSTLAWLAPPRFIPHSGRTAAQQLTAADAAYEGNLAGWRLLESKKKEPPNGGSFFLAKPSRSDTIARNMRGGCKSAGVGAIID